MENDLLAVSIPTAARMIDVSPDTLVVWCREGRIPAVKLGRAWRIKMTDLVALLNDDAVDEHYEDEHCEDEHCEAVQ